MASAKSDAAVKENCFCGARAQESWFLCLLMGPIFSGRRERSSVDGFAPPTLEFLFRHRCRRLLVILVRLRFRLLVMGFGLFRFLLAGWWWRRFYGISGPGTIRPSAGFRRASPGLTPTNPVTTWIPPRITKTCSRLEKTAGRKAGVGAGLCPPTPSYPSGWPRNVLRPRNLQPPPPAPRIQP